MKSKLLSLILLVGTSMIGIVYYLSSNSLMKTGESNAGEMGADYFPKLLAVILVALSLLSIIQTLLEKKSEKIVLGNWHLVLATLMLSAVYIFIWVNIGYFYIVTYIFLFSLIYIYQADRKSRKMLIVNAVTSFSVLIVIFVFFGLVLEVNF